MASKTLKMAGAGAGVILGLLLTSMAHPRVPTTSVAVVTAPIPADTAIPANAVKSLTLPTLTANRWHLLPPSAVIGRSVGIPLTPGSTIPAAIVHPWSVPPGMVALPISLMYSAAYQIEPGMRVAVFTSSQNPQNPSQLINPRALVVAVDFPASTSTDPQTMGVVVLAVPPAQATQILGQTIVLAASRLSGGGPTALGASIVPDTSSSGAIGVSSSPKPTKG
ncbi:hypothetical protein Sulac_1203 [Sulfobacillus acidophilus DSM 10332]|uniref:SAF domain-containing protein n=1 Tax=Sulfobacillus acidophilus (strain ATCC 700253 / DSM 10332 / NAL) TaxID=679936 RepID=G8TV63_SULAD|nr:hypothetical protein Sulac_1203 [Sulfobacillus acidophilus DSM 10332]